MPRLRILVVDDDPVFIGVAAAALIAKGHSVVCAPDGIKAAGLIEQDDFDVVALDCGLKGKSELQLLTALARASSVKRRLVISARVTPFYQRVLALYGASTVVAKPIAPAALVQLVEDAFVRERA